MLSNMVSKIIKLKWVLGPIKRDCDPIKNDEPKKMHYLERRHVEDPILKKPRHLTLFIRQMS